MKYLLPPAVALSLLACSSGPPGSNLYDPFATPDSGLQASASCDMGSSCGGDLNGTWHYVSGCLPSPPLPPMCSQAVWHDVGSVDGTLTFDTAGMTYEVTRNYDFRLYVLAPSSCSCTDVGAFAHAMYSDSDCMTLHDTCVCGESSGEGGNSNGAISAMGPDTVTFNGTTYHYCVSGSTLHLWSPDAPSPENIVLTLTR